MFELYFVCCLFSVLRCTARVAPPVDETEDELSFQDEFLSLSRQLGIEVEVKLEVASRRRQRDLRDNKSQSKTM